MVDAYRPRACVCRLKTSPHTLTSRRAPFPCLVTAGGERIQCRPTSARRHGTIHLKRLMKNALWSLCWRRLTDGGCALIVRNTVRRAFETYELLRRSDSARR